MSAARAKKLPLAESKRELIRVPVRREDRFSIRSEDGSLRGRVVNINSAGTLIDIPPTAPFTNPPIGSSVKNLQLLINDVIIGQYPVAVVCHVNDTDPEGAKIGLRFCEPAATGNPLDRKQSRVKIQDSFLPTGKFNNPLAYNDIILFKVLDISASGARLTTSARNHHILRGQKINDVEITFPTLGRTKVDVLVEWIRKQANQDLLEFGVTFLTTEKAFSSIVSQHLLVFGVGESLELRSAIAGAGVRTKQTKKTVTYDIVANEEDYSAALKLRHEAYSRAGKVDSNSHYSIMADKYDAHSYIIVAKHGNQVVGSLRFTYCADETQSFELDESIKIPEKFNPRKCLEASRACVSVDFENTDLIHGLFETGAQISAKVGAEWVITSCDFKLLPLYKKLGFKVQGKPFHLTTLGNIPHLFIVAPVSVIHTSKGLNPLIWYFSYRNVALFLKQLGYVKDIRLSLPQRVVQKVGLFVIKLVSVFK